MKTLPPFSHRAFMKAVPYTVLPRVLLIFSLKFGYLVRLYLEHYIYLYLYPYLYLLYVYSDIKSTYVPLHLSLPPPPPLNKMNGF